MVNVIVGDQPFQRAASLSIRMAVFVLEKKIAMAEEFDAYDEKGRIYAVLYDQERPVSTARFLPENTEVARITRVATLAEYRGQGYGQKVLEALEDFAGNSGYKRLVIHSELTAKAFYEKLGYKAFGPIYQEDGQPCQSLEKEITH